MRDAEALQELELRAADAVAKAKEAGASDVFVAASRSRGVELEMRDGTLEKVQESTSRSLDIELWVDGRYGAHSTTDLRPDRLTAFLTDAVALTRALQPDAARRIPDPALYEGRSGADLELIDEAVVALSREERLRMLSAMGEVAAGAPKLISATSGVNSNHNLVALASSNGFEGTAEGSSLWLSTSVTLQDEGDRRPAGGMWAGGRHLDEVPDPAQIATDAVAWASERLGMEKGPTKKTTMVVHPRAAGMLVWRLLQPAGGAAVQQGRSFWADQLGEPLVSPSLEIVDDPLVPRGLSSRHFDGEGIAARAMPVLADGALQNLYLDTYYAAKLGMQPTTGSPSNRIVAPGQRALEDLIGATDDGYLVTGWLGGNMDGTTGDFSFGIRGFRIEGGARSQSVGEMNVTGNILQLFSALAEVGSDPWPYASLKTPTLVFEGVQFSGA